MIPVVQVMAGADVGGAESFFERLVLALPDDAIRQTVVVRRNAEREARLRAAGPPPVALRFAGRWDLVTRWQVRNIIRTQRPRVVLAWMNRATSLTSRAVPGVPYALAARLGGYYNLKYYRHCHHLIGNTKGICDYLVAEGWPAARTHYLPNFVESYEGPVPPRTQFGVPDGKRMLLAAGRLHDNKAFDVLIDAMRELPEVHLCLAGTGPRERDLKERARGIGIADRVTWLGWVSDLGPLYRAADVFVCPSRHEPLGNVVIEAWANGCPVVAAAAQGPRELIEDGVNGCLVPVEDPAALAAAIGRLVASPAQASALAQGGVRSYAAAFTREAVVARYVEFFETVAP